MSGGGGGGGDSSPQTQVVTQSNIPEYARPYFESMMQRSQGLLSQDYTPYTAERIAGFTPEQKAVQAEILNMKSPQGLGQASSMAAQAGQAAAAAGNYSPTAFNVQQVGTQDYVSPEMAAAFSQYAPQLQQYQMEGPESFSAQAAQQYMSPFMQNVLEVQKREAILDAQRTQLAQDLGAARQGTYGGSRQLIAALERERNLGQNLSDIQARGLQAAYEAAQGQFNTEQQARQAAARTNLESLLGVQKLGVDTGLQVAMANLNADQQARVQNLAAQLQTQGLNAEQALKAALANQQYGLEAQRLSEQSRQFGADQRMQGLAQATQAAQTMANIGQVQSTADLARLQQQQSVAAQEQALQQQFMDQQYQDFLKQRDYPLEMLQQYSSLLRGVPVTPSTTQAAYEKAPSLAQQLIGGGLGALGMYKSLAG